MSGVLNLLLAGAASAIKDAYYNLTTLLLNTSSTNGAQNNTFLDSSSSPITLTTNGTPAQGTFTPFSQTGWSNYTSAVASNYINFTTSPGTLFQFSGDFTIEAWIYPTLLGTGESLWVSNDGGSTYLAFNITTTNYDIYLNSSGVTSSIAHGINLNQWNHCAMVRSGSTVTIYTNGVSKGTITNSSTLGYANPSINRNGGGGSAASWYMSNLRIVKSAVYTSAFTPSTTPLTNIANTSLLTCQSNRFLDSSSNALVATVTGTPSVQAFSPFAPTAAYSASTVGGSGLFIRANSDNLTLPNNSFLVGSSDFSLETWAYQFDRSGSQNFFGNQTDRTTAAGSSWNIAFTNSAGLLESTTWVGGTPYNLTSSVAPPLNAWNHIVWSRTGGTQSLFLNGTRVATRSDMGTLSVNNGSTANPPAIGCNGGGAGDVLNGYLSGFKIIIGSGGYDATQSTITVPTAPPTNTTNTKILANFTNSGIFDSSAKNDLQTVGNAQVSTTQAKWGTTAIYFDGSGDYLVGNSGARTLEFLTGDFTVECWIRFITVGNGQIITADPTSSSIYWQYYSSELQIGQVGVGAITTASWSPSANTWYHIAVTRSGTTVRQFVDGTQLGTNATSSVSLVNGQVKIGSGGAGDFNGYIDDLRVTKGYARYTANFSVPTTAFALQ